MSCEVHLGWAVVHATVSGTLYVIATNWRQGLEGVLVCKLLLLSTGCSLREQLLFLLVLLLVVLDHSKALSILNVKDICKSRHSSTHEVLLFLLRCRLLHFLRLDHLLNLGLALALIIHRRQTFERYGLNVSLSLVVVNPFILLLLLGLEYTLHRLSTTIRRHSSVGPVEYWSHFIGHPNLWMHLLLLLLLCHLPQRHYRSYL